MKKSLCGLFVISLLLGLSFGQELTGPAIIQRVNETINLDSSYSRSKMTIVTSSGDKRTFLMESWSKNKGEKNFVRYLEPGRVKDQAVLMLNHADDIWMFFPRTQRVRKLATHAKKQKMQGSDFSYEDMGSGEAFVEDYDARRLEDEKKAGYDCYKLELARKEGSDISYSRLIIWVIKENFLPVAIDYYDEKDPSRLQKRLVQSDIRVLDGIPTAMKAVMHNANDNTQTEMELLDVKFNLGLDDDLFTERALKR
ncbi:MAG: outer membrane lipoprotein-sorting protein [Candidatus Aminicenantes bacterium]|nr:outer membrane lipoprotein-sorting protein [Candidatus Aminicenantes bacterium]